jgi:hypothetical protein
MNAERGQGRTRGSDLYIICADGLEDNRRELTTTKTILNYSVLAANLLTSSKMPFKVEWISGGHLSTQGG